MWPITLDTIISVCHPPDNYHSPITDLGPEKDYSQLRLSFPDPRQLSRCSLECQQSAASNCEIIECEPSSTTSQRWIRRYKTLFDSQRPGQLWYLPVLCSMFSLASVTGSDSPGSSCVMTGMIPGLGPGPSSRLTLCQDKPPQDEKILKLAFFPCHDVWDCSILPTGAHCSAAVCLQSDHEP